MPKFAFYFNPSLSVCKFSLHVYILSTQNKLSGNENKANDHQQLNLSKMKKKILSTYLQEN